MDNGKIKILVIEDELEIRANLLDLLDMEGYVAIGADNGITGLIGALEHHPDIILCDVMMPELDGHEVLAALRQEPETALTPFIFLTALADKGDIRQGMKLGADDYITKPFVCGEVIDAINIRLQKQTALAERNKAEQAIMSALQEDVQAFRDGLDNERAVLISDVRSQIKTDLKKLSIASDILKTLPHSEERVRSAALIQSVCNAQVKLLSRIPNFDHLPNDRSFEQGKVEKSKAEDSIEELLSGATEEEILMSLS